MKKIIIVLMVLLLTGCYDYNELNDLEIVSSMIVDKEDDNYVINLEILDTSSDAETGSYFLTGYGKTMESALDNVFFESAEKPFYSHMHALIFSEEVAKDGLEVFFDYLLRGTDFRKDFYLFVTENTEDLLEYETQPKESIGEMIKMSAERNQEGNGRYKSSNLREVAYQYLRNNIYIIGGMTVEDEKLVLTDSYAFIDNKMDTRIEGEAALLSNILTKKNNSFAIYGVYSYVIHEYKADVSVKKDKITITIKGNARISNASDASDLDIEAILEREEKMNEQIENDFLETLQYSRNMDFDIFNLGYYYYMHYPKLLESDTWKNIEVEVVSKVKISEKGLLLKSLGGTE